MRLGRLALRNITHTGEFWTARESLHFVILPTRWLCKGPFRANLLQIGSETRSVAHGFDFVILPTLWGKLLICMSLFMG